MKESLKIGFYIFLVVLFVLGAYVYSTWPSRVESFNDRMGRSASQYDPTCPDLLLEKGGQLLLYNTLQPEQEGINPRIFTNLDEYTAYVETQRAQGQRCPVLYLLQEYNTQGDSIYRMRADPTQTEGGRWMPSIPEENNMSFSSAPMFGKPADIRSSLAGTALATGDALGTTPPMVPVTLSQVNTGDAGPSGNSYAGFDPMNQNVGVHTRLDTIHEETSQGKVSENPMDPNWGGVLYTAQIVETGKYKENEVTKPTYFQPNSVIYYHMDSNTPQPANYSGA